MNEGIRVKSREVKIEKTDLSPIEIKKIEADIENEFKKLEEKDIIDTMTQLATVIVKYAIENYIRNRDSKAEDDFINSNIDSLIKIAKQAEQKDTMF
jgi:hypothetical protein